MITSAISSPRSTPRQEHQRQEGRLHHRTQRQPGSAAQDVKLFVAEQRARDFTVMVITRDETVDGDHGRIETRQYTLIYDVAWLEECHDRPGLAGIVIVERTRQTASKTEQETASISLR